jgi:hypothetical protein
MHFCAPSGGKISHFSAKKPPQGPVFLKKTSFFEKKVRFFLVVSKLAVPLHRF